MRRRPLSQSGPTTNASPAPSRSATRTLPRRALVFAPNAELDEIRETLRETGDFSPYSNAKLEQLFAYLREMSADFGRKELYDDAQVAHTLSDDVTRELSTRCPRRSVDCSVLSNNAEEKRTEFEDHWAKTFQDYDDETSSKRTTLSDRQKNDTTEFERLWSEDMPHKYRKPSAQLLQLRRVEKSFAMTGDFVNAKHAHVEFQALAEIEAAQAQSSLVADYDVARSKHNGKQQGDMALFEATRQHERELMVAQYRSEQSAFTNRSLVVRARQTEVKRPRANTGNGHVPYKAVDRGWNQELLLPPLRPPNDPDLVQEKEKRRRESDRRKLAQQKRSADEIGVRRFVGKPASGAKVPVKGPKVIVTNRGGVKVVDRVIEPTLVNEPVESEQ